MLALVLDCDGQRHVMLYGGIESELSHARQDQRRVMLHGGVVIELSQAQHDDVQPCT